MRQSMGYLGPPSVTPFRVTLTLDPGPWLWP